MKNLTKIYIPFVFGILLMLSACSLDQNPNSPDESEDAVTSPYPVEGEELLAVAAPTYKDCKNLCRRTSPTNYEIDSDCVDCLVSNFKANGSVLPQVSGQNMKGFEISEDEIAELNKVINAIKGRGNTPSVHGMFGIKSDGTTGTPELYFEIDEIKGSTVLSRAYYDFTQPCPDYCPN